MVLVSRWLLTITFMSLQSQESQTTHQIPNQLVLPLSNTILLPSVTVSSLRTLEPLKSPSPRGLHCTGRLCEHLGFCHAGSCFKLLPLAPLCPLDRRYYVPSCVPGSLLDSGVQMLNQAYKVPTFIELIFSLEVLSLLYFCP